MTRIRFGIKQPRSGISRVGVLVVLGIVLFLGTLITAGILSARQSARKLSCLCRMKNIALSIQNYASVQGVLPSLTSSIKIQSGEPLATDGELIAGWPIAILPAMDKSHLYREIQRNAVVESGRRPDAIFRVGDGERVHFDLLTCPDDAGSQNSGRMNWVFNAGFISRTLYTGDPQRKHLPGSLSWDGNDVPGEDSDVKVHSATGVAWHANTAFRSSLNLISEGDGTSNTLMLTENLQAGYWYDTDTTRIGFMFPVADQSGQVPFGVWATFESPVRPLNSEFVGGNLLSATPQDWQINADSHADIGSRPRPSSWHSGQVTAVICDSSGRSINQKIDPHVYLKLLTSNGVQYGEKRLLESEF